MSLLTFLFPSTAVELLSGTFLDPDEEGALSDERKLLSADRAAVSVSTGGRAGAGGGERSPHGHLWATRAISWTVTELSLHRKSLWQEALIIISALK